MDEFERGINSASEKFDEFSKNFEKIGKKMSDIGSSMTTKITLPLAGFATAAGKMSMDFENAMAKVGTIADTSVVPLKTLESAIIGLSNETGVASSDIAESVYNVISATGDTAGAVDLVRNATQLATAGFTDSESAMSVLTTAMNAYGLSAQDATKISDSLIMTQNLGVTTVADLASNMGRAIATASAYGVGLENLEAGYVALTKSGISTAEGTTYLSSMFNELGKAGGDVSKILQEQTGMSFGQLMDGGYSLADVLGILYDSTGQSNEGFINLWSSAEAGKAANAIVNQGLQEFNTNLETISNSMGTTQSAYETMQTNSFNLNKVINELKNAITELGNVLVPIIVPAFTAIVEKATDAVRWFTSLDEGTQRLILTIAGIAAAVGPVLIVIGKIITALTTIGGAISSVVGFVTGGISSILSIGGKLMGGVKALFALLMAHPVVAIVTAIIAAVVLLWNNCEEFRNAIGAIWDAIVGFFAGAWEEIKAAWGNTTEFFAAIWEGIQSIFQGVAEFFGAIFQSAAEIVQTVWSAIVDFFSAVWQGIQSIFSTVAEVLGGFFQAAAEVVQAAWSAVVEFFSGVWEGIKNVFSVVAEVLGDFFSAAWEAVQSAWSAAVEFFSGVWQGIQNVFSAVAEVLGGFFQAAWEAIQTAWEAVVEFFSGVWEGIQSVFSVAADVLGGFFKAAWDVVQGVWEAATEFFGGIADGIHAAFEAVTQFLGDAFSAAWEIVGGIWGAAVEFFSGVWDGITGVFGAVAEWFGGIFSKAWDAITAVWEGVTEFFSGVWEDIKGVFSDVWETFKEIGGNILHGLWEGVSGAFGWAKEKIGGVVDGIVGLFTGKDGFDTHSPSKTMEEIGKNVMLGLGGGVSGQIGAIDDNMKKVITAMKDAFTGLTEYFTDIGQNAMSSLASAMSSGISALQQKVAGLMSSIASAAKAALGIHSPSKVFAGIGQNMVLGLADGWNDEYSGIKRQIERGLDFGPAHIGLDASYSGAARYGAQDIQTRGAGGMGNTTVNIYSPEAVDAVQAAREWKKTMQRMAMEYA